MNKEDSINLQNNYLKPFGLVYITPDENHPKIALARRIIEDAWFFKPSIAPAICDDEL